MMRKLVLIASCLLIALAAAGCGLLGLQSPTEVSQRAQVEETIRTVAAAGETKDIATLKSHVANAIVTQIAETGNIGHAGLAPQSAQDVVDALQKLWADKSFNRIALSPTSVRLDGGAAVAAGQFVVEFTDAQGNETACSGSGELTLVSNSGQWVVTRVTVTEGGCTTSANPGQPGPTPEPSPQPSPEPQPTPSPEPDPATEPETPAAPQTFFDKCGYFIAGQTDDQIQAIQTGLNFLGFGAGQVDGYYGPQTVAAVKAFQTGAGLYVDGEFGPKTIAAFDAALAEKGGYYTCGVTATAPSFGTPGSSAGETTLTETSLRGGTSYETPVLTYESPNPGPTLFFVGCIHGNEQSGHAALAEAIAQGISISKGRLVIVPTFSRPACESDRRTTSTDFNRMFPVGGSPTTATADEMWNLVRSQPDLAFVVDFHDGFVNSLADTLIHTQQSKAGSVARSVRDQLNAIRPSGATGPSFRAFTEPIGGSLTRKVGRDLGIPAMEVELAGRSPGDPLSLRKEYGLKVLQAVGREFGVEISF